MSDLILRNRQRLRRLNMPVIRQITRHLLDATFKIEIVELGIHFVSSKEMAHVNQEFLQHEGDTDVITFDYSEPNGPLTGEILISPAVAIKQAGQFRTSWQEEMARYIVHGLLHLQGYDDLQPVPRKRMKAREHSIMRRLKSEFELQEIEAPSPRRKRSRTAR